MTKPVVVLSEAYFTTRPNYGFECLRGAIASDNHPHLTQGAMIWTSPIVAINEADNTVETENTLYSINSWRDVVRAENRKLVEEEGVGYATPSQ